MAAGYLADLVMKLFFCLIFLIYLSYPSDTIRGAKTLEGVGWEVGVGVRIWVGGGWVIGVGAGQRLCQDKRLSGDSYLRLRFDI